ncbi:MAG: hypothetical protein HC922_03665 [Leptolyngbyaceae cyanobacterium SM2_3_12]|nr:hypothetical protein [Leptolyngbyaceae cyanobacterium SM2_3_12]
MAVKPLNPPIFLPSLPNVPVQSGRRRGRLFYLVTLLALGSLALGGCRNDTATAPEALAPGNSPDVPPMEEASPASPTPAETPTAAPLTAPTAPVSQAPAPATGPPSQGTALPDALLKEWQPLSDVLAAFGPMTLTSTEVTWGSGQSSPYTVISSEGGYLLQLSAAPSFYDIPNPYIKLMPKTNASGVATSMELAFYESDAKLKGDEYIMYGSYFVE